MAGKLVYTDTGVMYDDGSGNLSTPTQDQLNQFNTGDATVPIEDFEKLLGKLEGSKMRQQRQKSVEGRRDIYSQGLASMMSNF